MTALLLLRRGLEIFLKLGALNQLLGIFGLSFLALAALIYAWITHQPPIIAFVVVLAVFTCALVCGLALLGHYRRMTLSGPSLIGLIKWWGITWNFGGYFLGMVAHEGKNIRVSSFQVTGSNNSRNRLEHVTGFIESKISGETISVLLDSMPPEETFGIPPKCDFRVTALFYDPKDTRERASEGITAEDFLKRFGSFRFVFQYDGKKETHEFSEELVRTLLNKWRDEINPQSRPIVTSRVQRRN